MPTLIETTPSSTAKLCTGSILSGLVDSDERRNHHVDKPKQNR
jgi:hypothetical protein